MVKHIIVWKLKSELSDSEKARIKSDIKRELEALCGIIPGLLEMKININPLPSSSGDFMLDSTFTDEKALKEYAIHPQHVYVADTFVRPYSENRLCLDFETDL